MHVTEKLIPNSIVPFSKANIISTAALINGGLLFCLLLGMTPWYALYFYKRAVTVFQSLPVCYGGCMGGASGFLCYLFMPTIFFLLATQTPPLTNSRVTHRNILLL